MFGRKKVNPEADGAVSAPGADAPADAAQAPRENSEALAASANETPGRTATAPAPGETEPNDVLLEHKDDTDNDDEAAQARLALQSRLRASNFAEIVSVLLRSPKHRELRIADLSWLVVPPFSANQYVLARGKPKDSKAAPAPIGVALWARVSDDVDRRLSADPPGALKLEPNEWVSGDNLWLVDLVAPPQVAKALLQRLQTTAFAGKQAKMRGTDADGTHKIVTLKGAEPGGV